MAADPNTWVERLAPAKVNLFLHVGPVAADGYHPVCSLMVFADVGDMVRMRASPRLGFHVEGPFAAGLAETDDNLVVQARDALLDRVGRGFPSFELVLDKRLPIAAGLGGGSADAAATLALVGDRLAAAGGIGIAEAIAPIARALGADVTACLASNPVIGRGRGDDIVPAPALPTLNAVLVNPLAPSPTGPVYRAFDGLPPGAGADEPLLPKSFHAVEDVVEFLRTTRNDLEGPAIGLQPLIGEVLTALRSHREALFIRMSGSGATCFALTRDEPSAVALAAALSDAHPGWWVRACRLNA